VRKSGSFPLVALLVPLFGGALACAGQTTELLTLPAARATALRNHPQVVIAQLQELVAQETVKQNEAAYFPTANGYFDAVQAGNSNTRILAGGLTNSVIYDRVADGLGLTELITDFGQTHNLVASARASARAETAGREATDQQILLNVDVNYFNTLEARAVQRVAEETVRARQVLVDQVNALAKNRLKSDLDVSFAGVAFEQSRLILQKAESDADAAEASLSAALGYRGMRHFELADDFPTPDAIPDADTLIDTALRRRPDLLRLHYERDAAERYARAQKDRNYPTIDATGLIGNAISHDDRLPNKYAAGGITVNLPLFAGGQDLARQHAAELKTRIADQAVRDEEDKVERDVRLAWLNYNSALQRFHTTEELLRYSNQSNDLAQARYRIGASSIVELTEAQLNATSARIAEANARYDEFIQRAILDYQTGAVP
jgi:outer membrane protein